MTVTKLYKQEILWKNRYSLSRIQSCHCFYSLRAWTASSTIKISLKVLLWAGSPEKKKQPTVQGSIKPNHGWSFLCVYTHWSIGPTMENTHPHLWWENKWWRKVLLSTWPSFLKHLQIVWFTSMRQGPQS